MAPLAAALLAGVACAPRGPDPRRPDLVLIVVDTLRADHLGAYGYDRPTSPNIDALAGRGLLFEEAWSAAPWTLPSVMSILTGRYPSRHRVENDGLKLGAAIRTLAEVMTAAGYETAAFVAHIYVSRAFGFARGFGTFKDFGLSRPGYRLEAGMEPTAGEVTRAALDWLGGIGPAPIFLFVHYFDPHWPYDPPRSYAAMFPSEYGGPLDATYDSISKFQDPLVALPEDYRRFLIDRYDGEIRYVDEQIGRLLDGLIEAGRGERTWVIVTADHGEEFKEHGSMGHGRHLYQESIRVPLVIGRPLPPPAGSRPGAAGASAAIGAARVTEPAAGVDLFPTVLDLAGVAGRPQGLQGRSLAGRAAMGGEGTDPGGGPPRPIVSETIRLNAYRKAVRLGPLKLIRFMDDNREELYDLREDPGERRDLSAGRPGDVRRLLRALFDQVDVLTGGWNLRWSSDGAPRRFQGQIRTDGIFRAVVPLFRERGRYAIEAGRVLNFTDADQTGESGLSFSTAPDEARVSFYLMVDGEPAIDEVFLGGNRAGPRAMPFVLGGVPEPEAAFARPPHRAGRERGFYIWRNRAAAPGREIVLDEEIRERLRSLGYVD
ncbi:MAG: sulfatase [Acidobacteriota bacterium]